MKHDAIEIHKWSDDLAPDEKGIRKILAAEGLKPYCWSDSPGDVYSVHSHCFY